LCPWIYIRDENIGDLGGGIGDIPGMRGSCGRKWQGSDERWFTVREGRKKGLTSTMAVPSVPLLIT
jgi:hypothetical protein